MKALFAAIGLSFFFFPLGVGSAYDAQACIDEWAGFLDDVDRSFYQDIEEFSSDISSHAVSTTTEKFFPTQEKYNCGMDMGKFVLESRTFGVFVVPETNIPQTHSAYWSCRVALESDGDISAREVMSVFGKTDIPSFDSCITDRSRQRFMALDNYDRVVEVKKNIMAKQLSSALQLKAKRETLGFLASKFYALDQRIRSAERLDQKGLNGVTNDFFTTFQSVLRRIGCRVDKTVTK